MDASGNIYAAETVPPEDAERLRRHFEQEREAALREMQGVYEGLRKMLEAK